MSRINCKCCGCPNEVEQGKFVCICEACGTEQAIPNLDSEKKTNLFNRANAARLKCDFEKALQNYEQILIDYPNDAEAHWGIVLCRYGIEYVDDPKTKKKIPTCHRTLYQSIFDDIDYKEAIASADVIARKIYQDEAEYIEKIQKSIIAISQKESPYDIFICYKESDEEGKRTRDSFVAEDIYNELVAKEYKVFFSRITLESKLGQQYEPIIFAALQSAKVMLVIGSKKEYFEAPWVKNEWTRYLSFMAENKTSKYMIPCYRDMEAYDMPDEFLNLQSQNLDRLGAKQDLLRAIDKVFGKDKVIVKQQNNYGSNNGNNESLLKRTMMLIDDGDFTKADQLLEKVLNDDPENSTAYLYKVLIENKINDLNQIAEISPEKILENHNLKRARKYATNDQEALFDAIDLALYNKAIELKNDKYYKESLEYFNMLENYKDSLEQLQEVLELISKQNKEQETLKKAIELKNEHKYEEASKIFRTLTTVETAINEADNCEKILKDAKDTYELALQLKNADRLASALEKFKTIEWYSDTKEQIIEINHSTLKNVLQLKEQKYQECFFEGEPKNDNDIFTLSQKIKKLKEINDYKNAKELVIEYENKIELYNIRKEAREKNKITIPLLIILTICCWPAGLIAWIVYATKKSNKKR